MLFRSTDLFGASSLPDLGGDALLQLAFEVLAPGTADMVLEMRECRVTAGDPGPCSLSATRIVRGAVTQDPVRNDRASFGSLKARFGQSSVRAIGGPEASFFQAPLPRWK